MTAKELYEWAKKEKLENAEMIFWHNGLEDYMPVFKAECNEKGEIILYW